MEQFLYYTKLFDIYKNLLNENEKNVFAYYFEENYSLQEIADIEGVSKARIGAIVKTLEQKLDSFEEKLNILKKYDAIRQVTDDTIVRTKIENIIAE